MKKETKSLIVLSGGQDSTTCALMANRSTEIVGAIFVDYGQKHLEAEKACAKKLCDFLGITLYEHKSFLGDLGETALTKNSEYDVRDSHPKLIHLPASFVPGRNLLFLTYAAALAMRLGATEIWTGVCETDYSGYPDCRQLTIDALSMAIRLGMDFEDFRIITPLMNMSKAETFMWAYKDSMLPWIIKNTHTGYEGKTDKLRFWGYGPPDGEVPDPASVIRAKGMIEFIEMIGKDRYNEYARENDLVEYHG